MTLISFSLAHRTAPLGAREAAVRSLGDLGAWFATLDRSTIAEALVVSTCHRLELYLVSEDEAHARSVVAAACGLPSDALEGNGAHGWSVRRDEDAAVHLARVAVGLDSLIVGEAEIAGQVRRSASFARESGVLGPRLQPIIAGALRASGRARSETKISAGVMSAASAGVAMATSTFGSLDGLHILVIGAGQTARTALRRLSRRPAARVSVASRSRRHAEEAAAIAGADVWTLDEVPSRLGDLDVVLAATNGGACLITLAQCEVAFRSGPDRQRVLVDLSVPRVIDARAALLPGVTLWSVDDLGDLAHQSMRRREREIPAAEALAFEEGRRAFSRMQARRVARPTLDRSSSGGHGAFHRSGT